MKKAIIIGASLSGKTTIIKQLRLITNLPISEVDEELTKLNGGTFPADPEYKNNVLFPKIAESVINNPEIIFFTNTWYFSLQELKDAKQKGFIIIQLDVSLEVLKERNIKRQNEGYDNLEQYLEGMVEYQEILKKEKLVDYIVNAEQTVENVGLELLEIFKK
jgi:guanylate kinase